MSKELSQELYFELRAKLPQAFEKFSYEQLNEMIFNEYEGYDYNIDEGLQDAYRKFPRGLMIEILKEERDGAIRALEILEQIGQ